MLCNLACVQGAIRFAAGVAAEGVLQPEQGTLRRSIRSRIAVARSTSAVAAMQHAPGSGRTHSTALWRRSGILSSAAPGSSASESACVSRRVRISGQDSHRLRPQLTCQAAQPPLAPPTCKGLFMVSTARSLPRADRRQPFHPHSTFLHWKTTSFNQCSSRVA